MRSKMSLELECPKCEYGIALFICYVWKRGLIRAYHCKRCGYLFLVAENDYYEKRQRIKEWMRKLVHETKLAHYSRDY